MSESELMNLFSTAYDPKIDYKKFKYTDKDRLFHIAHDYVIQDKLKQINRDTAYEQFHKLEIERFKQLQTLIYELEEIDMLHSGQSSYWNDYEENPFPPLTEEQLIMLNNYYTERDMRELHIKNYFDINLYTELLTRYADNVDYRQRDYSKLRQYVREMNELHFKYYILSAESYDKLLNRIVFTDWFDLHHLHLNEIEHSHYEPIGEFRDFLLFIINDYHHYVEDNEIKLLLEVIVNDINRTLCKNSFRFTFDT